MSFRTLGIYLFSQYLGTFLRASLGICALILLIDMVEFSRDNADSNALDAQTVVMAAVLRLPGFYEKAIPFMVLTSSIITLLTLNRRSELTIMRAAGISTWKFLTPICIGSLLIGVLAIAVLNPVSSAAFSRAQNIEAGLYGKQTTDYDPAKRVWLRQRTDEGFTIIGAASTAQRGLLLSRASFFRIAEDGSIDERLEADTAHLEDGRWRLENAVSHRAGSAQKPLGTMFVKSGLKPEFVEETLARPESIPFYELPSKIEIARAFGMNANSFSTHFNVLLALPALLVAMTLIAATVSLRFVRSGFNLFAIYGGIAAGFSLYVFTFVVKTFGSAGLMSPILAAWLPVLAAGAFAISVLLVKEDG